MKINQDYYRKLKDIDWLSSCGNSHSVNPMIPFEIARERTTAIDLLFSIHTANVMTVAQGNLTSYLTKNHYSDYAGRWNSIAAESRAIIDEQIVPDVKKALVAGAWLKSLSDASILLDDPSLRSALGVKVSTLIDDKKWIECLTTMIAVSVNRGVLESTFRSHFPKAPVFFEMLVHVYSLGCLPCGWTGTIEKWPEGRMVIY